MESRQEIEQMRVVELREFLRRHDISIKNVARNDGTPGPPRKSELLAAALDIWQAQHSTQSPVQAPNPFQIRRTSPASLQRPQRPSVVEQPDMPAPTRSSSRAGKPSSRASAADAGREPAPEPAAPDTSNRARRRSSSYVDPSLLAQLQAPSASENQHNRAVASDDARRGRQEHARARPASRSVSGRRSASAAVRKSVLEPPEVDDVVKGTAPSASAPSTSRHVAGMDVERRSSAQPRTRATDALPVASRLSTAARSLLDVDENYVSDEDPDYEADDEPGEDENDSDASDDEYRKSVEVVDLTYGASAKRHQAQHDVDDEIQPVHGKGMPRAYDVGHEDIPFDSDAYESGKAQHSDRGSLVDTDGEEQLVDFTQWSAKDIRDWLRAHDVRFASLASKEELVGLVRAKVLQMETVDEEEEVSPVKQHSAQVSRKHAEPKPRRRRGITVPTEAEDEDEVVFVKQQVRKKSYEKTAKSTESKSFASKDRRSDGPRRLAMTSCYVMTFTLVVLWAYALQSIYLTSRIPFCDKDSPSNYTSNGELCRRCPRYGVCVDGFLFCDSGFVQSGVRCVRDHLFDRVVEHLANFAAQNLSELAGRAECGEAVSTKLSAEELKDNMIAHFYEMRRKDPSFFSVGLGDLDAAENAVHQAIDSLSEERHGVLMNNDRVLWSNRPRISFKCRLKRKAMENLHRISVGAVICILFLVIRVKLYVRRRRQRQCEAAHQRSLDVLRDQVVGYRQNEEDVAFVSDVLLREEVLGRPTPQVVKLWKDVEERLKSDPRVLRKHQTIRGMPSYTYEYVGSRRSSGSVFDSLSRRSSSFGSRASLDSLDFRTDDDFDATPRRGLGSYVMGFFDR